MAIEDIYKKLRYVSIVNIPDGTGGFEKAYKIGEEFEGSAVKSPSSEQQVAGIRDWKTQRRKFDLDYEKYHSNDSGTYGGRRRTAYHIDRKTSGIPYHEYYANSDYLIFKS